MYIYVCIVHVLAFNPNRAKQQVGGGGHLEASSSFQRYFIKAGKQAGRHELLVSCPWAASKKPGSTIAAHGYPAYKVGPSGTERMADAKCNESSGPDIYCFGLCLSRAGMNPVAQPD